MKEILIQNGRIRLNKSICLHSFSQAKKSPKMMEEFEKEILPRWGKLGFIQGLNGEVGKECAYAYEQLATYLVCCEDDQTDRLFTENKNFEAICFPMARKVITELEPNLYNFHDFLTYCKEFNVNDIIKEMDKLNPLDGDGVNTPYARRYFDQDVEAESVGIVCDMIVDKFKTPQKNNDEIRKEFLEPKLTLIKEKVEKIKNGESSSNHTDA
jgi:hypothetical protein